MIVLVVVLVVGGLFAFGAWTQHIAADFMLDAEVRDREGRQQLGGLSARRWAFWLSVSPWHLMRYAWLLRRERRGNLM